MTIPRTCNSFWDTARALSASIGWPITKRKWYGFGVYYMDEPGENGRQLILDQRNGKTRKPTIRIVGPEQRLDNWYANMHESMEAKYDTPEPDRIEER